MKKSIKERHNLILEKLEPYLNKDELGELFRIVYDGKSKNISLENVYNGRLDSFEAKVLHDANCLNKLIENVKEPTEAAKLFITCDYRLAATRKRFESEKNNIVTVDEIYEILLPYLLINENIISNPITVPNLLLASAIDIELGNTENIEDIVGNYLKHSSIPQNYKILCDLKQRNRFNRITKSIERSRKINDVDGYSHSINEFEKAKVAYKKDVKEHLASTLIKDTLKEKDEKIKKLTEEYDKLKTGRDKKSTKTKRNSSMKKGRKKKKRNKR
jgi:hypothetical protein